MRTCISTHHRPRYSQSAKNQTRDPGRTTASPQALPFPLPGTPCRHSTGRPPLTTVSLLALPCGQPGEHPSTSVSPLHCGGDHPSTSPLPCGQPGDHPSTSVSPLPSDQPDDHLVNHLGDVSAGCSSCSLSARPLSSAAPRPHRSHRPAARTVCC